MKNKIVFPLLTLFLIVVIIEVVGQVSSWGLRVSKYGSSDELKKTELMPNRKRVLCIGESTTDGRYPRILQQILDEKKPKKYQVIDSGYESVNSNFFVRNIEKIYEQTKPEYAVVMMGINDRFLISSSDFTERKNKYTPYVYKLVLYFYDLMSGSSVEERFLRLVNAQKNEEAKNLFLKNYKEFNNRKVISKAIQVITEETESDEYIEKVKNIIKDLIVKYPEDNDLRMDLLWFYTANDLNEIAKQEIEYLSQKKGMNQYLSTFIYQAYRRDDEARSYMLKAIEEGEILDLESKAILLILFGDERNSHPKVKELIRAFSKEDRKVLAPFLRKLTYKSSLEFSIKDELEFFEKNQFANRTLDNIFFVLDFLKSKGVKVYISHYPLRSTKIFENERFSSFNIISNQRNFQKVLKDFSYEEIFEDTFGGDFGHMTYKGQTILARNIYSHIWGSK